MFFCDAVPEGGLEPPCLAALPPQGSKSTNFSTRAGLSVGLVYKKTRLCRVILLKHLLQHPLLPRPSFLLALEGLRLMRRIH